MVTRLIWHQSNCHHLDLCRPCRPGLQICDLGRDNRAIIQSEDSRQSSHFRNTGCPSRRRVILCDWHALRIPDTGNCQHSGLDEERGVHTCYPRSYNTRRWDTQTGQSIVDHHLCSLVMLIKGDISGLTLPIQRLRPSWVWPRAGCRSPSSLRNNTAREERDKEQWFDHICEMNGFTLVAMSTGTNDWREKRRDQNLASGISQNIYRSCPISPGPPPSPQSQAVGQASQYPGPRFFNLSHINARRILSRRA